MSKITIVYHWSPSKNRDSILKDGIKIMMSTIRYENPISHEIEEWSPPYICTSDDPFTAYKYVLPTFPCEDIPDLDLFQVTISEQDYVTIRNDGTNSIIEFRINNSIPCDRIKYIATRKA